VYFQKFFVIDSQRSSAYGSGRSRRRYRSLPWTVPIGTEYGSGRYTNCETGIPWQGNCDSESYRIRCPVRDKMLV